MNQCSSIERHFYPQHTATRQDMCTDLLCDRQKIISVHTLVVVDLVVSTYTTCVDHYATRLIGFGVQQVVAFWAKLEGRLIERGMTACEVHWGRYVEQSVKPYDRNIKCQALAEAVGKRITRQTMSWRTKWLSWKSNWNSAAFSAIWTSTACLPVLYNFDFIEHIRMQSAQSFRRPYAGLLIFRACFAIFGTGYIHPDEYFQNGEVTAGRLNLLGFTAITLFYSSLEGRIFGYHELRTWEWDPSFPVRSIMPPFLTTGIPFLIAKLAFNGRT
jgi:hypothetical protein